MLTGLSGSAAWAVVNRQGEALRDRFVGQATLARESDRFAERARTIATPEALLRDRRTLQFVLESYGLESEIGKTAILRKLMTENPDAQGSLANKMVDQRYRQFARDFSGWDRQNPLTKTGALSTITERWQTARFEKGMGENSPGMREALYFRRNAAGAEKVTQLMADPALAFVVRVATGLPRQFAGLSFEQQRDVLERRVDMTTFSDPKRLDAFIRRFLVRYDIENGGATGGPQNPLAGLFAGGGGGTQGLFGLLGSRLNQRA